MKSLYLALGLMTLSLTTHAAFLSPADRDSIEQQQQQLLRQNQQQRESLERATPSLHAAMPAQAEASDGPCFSIHRIALDGATLIDPRQQQKIVQPWLGQCMDIARITKLVNIISDWYISRGYITSRVFLTEQDLRSGVLHLTILEGKLEKITMEGAAKRELTMAFPGLEGHILNLRDIEQGMEQINRTRATPVQIEIQPGEKPGGSIVNLTATAERPLLLSMSVDNSGQKSTGNSVVAGWINVASIGNGLWGTVGWNAAGGALTNQINGDNPLTGAITNGLGSAGGYWGGKLISSGTNAAGKWLTGGWDPKFNPDLLKYTEIKGQLGISKEMLPGKLPGNMGNIGASVISEGGGKGAEQVIKKIGDKNEKCSPS
ncbi:ShlB/FhaC/HecB family hemolysin secretion/activation protein [Klebsiella variicola]|uniref:ShlB/FhaC/HecB family hemolysin secretion/activation protein n=1 Tax=Klebsiella variicola TaxID=244366 RepID=UPI003F540FC9